MLADGGVIMTKAEDLTTHAGWGAGYPRLMITGDGGHREVPLRETVTRIGSGPEADIRLDGVAAVAGEIFHDENDEYVFIPHQEGETNARLQPMETATGQDGEVLRTGARFTLGEWTFVYMRDEYADHGRPFGGREGGEGEVQPDQPARPDYSADAEAAKNEE
jgi:hypothetical protein